MHMYLKHPWTRSERGIGQTPRVNDGAGPTRFVVDTAGRPLSKFRSTKELAVVLRNAIKGHQLAMERGGVLHHDVSSSNILIVEEPHEHPHSQGFLHDFDESLVTHVAPKRMSFDPPPLQPPELADDFKDVARCKELRTGAHHFIPFALLDPDFTEAASDSSHNLESFFWVLLWIILRHTKYERKGGRVDCKRFFKYEYEDDEDLAAGKLVWLLRRTKLNPVLAIIGNPPLTALLNSFTALMYDALLRMGSERVPLTYAAILHIFDTAIEREDWPVREDEALPFEPLPEKWTTQIIFDRKKPLEHGQSKKRSAEGVQNDLNTESPGILFPNASTPTAKRSKLIPAMLRGRFWWTEGA
ncbi:hypothetical protein VTO73DRAFT_8871 [Trametes versicolor]